MYRFDASHNLLFNASKTKCMYFDDAGSQLQNTAKFMGRPIEYVDNTDLLGVSVASRIRERNVNSSAQKFYCRVNRVFFMILKIYHVMLKLNCLTLIVWMCTNPSYGIIANMMRYVFLLDAGNLYNGFGKFRTPHTVILYHLSIH